MLHNQIHKFVHSSAMYYQNLIIIHECSKKLLKMQNSESFLTPIVFKRVGNDINLYYMHEINNFHCRTKYAYITSKIQAFMIYSPTECDIVI